MNTCYDCHKETENTPVSNNGDEPKVYCDDCVGFPNHEYVVTCPTCNLDILVN